MKRVSRNELYSSPLPLRTSPLPLFIPHNPLSWVWYLWEYLFPTIPTAIVCRGDINLSSDSVQPLQSQQLQVLSVTVANVDDMNCLWRMGFFGKGTQSRSEPVWHSRTSRRLGLEGGDLTSEDITIQRRQARNKLKQQRAAVELEELNKRRAADGQPALSSEQTVQEQKSANNDGSGETTEKQAPELRPEDKDLINPDGTLKRIETLQLMPCEALFLAFGVGCLQVYLKNEKLSTAQLFCLMVKNPAFIRNYVAYHHYRSLGWCVRSGVKFGTDFILYKRGPPFQHAEFAIMVVPMAHGAETEPQKAWWWLTSVNRVVSGVKKTLVLCYVDGPAQLPSSCDDPDSVNISDVIRLFKVREVVYRRWMPTKNRD